MRPRSLVLVTTLMVLTHVAASADIAKDLRLEAPPGATGGDIPAPPQGLAIRAWSDKDTGQVRVGESIEIVFKANADCYAYVVDVGTTGSATLIFPNRKASANRLRADKVHYLPERGTYSIKVEGPAGTEHVVVVASSRPLPVWENLHRIAPRKRAGELGLGPEGSKGFKLVPGRTEEPAAPAAGGALDLDAFLVALEGDGHVRRGRNLAHAVITLAVEPSGRRETEAATGEIAGPAPAPTSGARLSIEVSPTGRIYVDGKYRGMGRAHISDVGAGDHEVTILQEGYRTHVEQVSIQTGESRTVRVDLQRIR